MLNPRRALENVAFVDGLRWLSSFLVIAVEHVRFGETDAPFQRYHDSPRCDYSGARPEELAGRELNLTSWFGCGGILDSSERLIELSKNRILDHNCPANLISSGAS